jgi:hypothetical protein
MFPDGNIEREKSKFDENVPVRERSHVVCKFSRLWLNLWTGAQGAEQTN